MASLGDKPVITQEHSHDNFVINTCPAQTILMAAKFIER